MDVAYSITHFISPKLNRSSLSVFTTSCPLDNTSLITASNCWFSFSKYTFSPFLYSRLL